MNMQQIVQTRSSSNGYDRRKIENDTVAKFDNKFQTAKTNFSKHSFGKGLGLEPPSRDRLIYITTGLIGQQVEVQVVDGSIFSGVFDTANADDFGVVLKMAHLVKDSSQGHKSLSDSPCMPPARTLIIPAKDLVQVIAKGVPVTRDGLTNELQQEKQQELMTDSYIAQYRHVEVGRELEPWVPDENDPGCLDLENTFDGPWNRGWDQFEANATLFGVKSTFDEELYTTKIERGPQMRQLESKASRIAREIEGEETLDLHLAEERGIQLDGYRGIDEETLYSSVYRGVDDSGYDEIEEIISDSQNDETFGSVSSSRVGKPLIDVNTGRSSDDTQVSSISSSMVEVSSSRTATSRDAYHSGCEEHGPRLLAEQLPKDSSVVDVIRVQDNQLIGQAKSNYTKEDKESQLVSNKSQASGSEDLLSMLRLKKESPDKIGLSPNATTFDPSRASSKGQEKVSSPIELLEGATPPKTQGTTSSLVRPSSSASSTSERGGATSTSAGRGLSSSSSFGSMSSEKSTSKSHAKESKLNPNAKSFIPSQTPLRPTSPVGDSPFYYPTNVAPQMPGMPVGIGIGPSFAAQQPVIFNPQAAPTPQPYYHPNGPQYTQQMIIGQPRPVFYMPTYTPEMQQYKGREL